MVDKTINYHNRSPKTWDNNALLIAGNEKVFNEQSDKILKRMVAQGYFAKRLYVDQSSQKTVYFGNTDTLISHLNSGVGYINFVGHGGGGIWSDRSLLGRYDKDKISNGDKTPIVTSMTCFTGVYADTTYLGRMMLGHSNGGAAGWYGSSGRTYVSNDFLALKPLNDLLINENDLTIGEMISNSKVLYFAMNADKINRATSTLYQFNYAGDPALKFHRPKNREIEVSPVDPEPGEMVMVNFNISPTDSISYQ